MTEFPSIDAMPQAHSKDEICHMAKDSLEALENIPTHSAEVRLRDGDRHEVMLIYRSQCSSAESYSPTLGIA